ncbi:MAG: aldo/keto reductase [Candidatus Bathyarchaeota archaeon]|nr:aldo/keto reductase [Candidatus Bathyarchaeota archaeon]
MLKVPMVKLGGTGLKVSKLGFGTFDFGVSSLNISPEEGGRILVESYKLGVKFWDTSDDYGSQPHVASALKRVPRKEAVISTKTSAKSGEEAKKSLKSSLKELNTDYVDIFLLHFVKSDWIDGCHQVLKELNDLKTTGIVKAIGLSTHSVTVVREASKFDEVDVLMTICCKADQVMISKFRERIPLEDGSIEEMFHAIKLAHSSGKGVIAMKVLGTSAQPLVRNYQSSIKSIAQLDFVDTMVIGMRSLDEVKKNAKVILSG